MLIDDDLIRFCAEKTREVAIEHDKACGMADADIRRSAEDLHLILMGKHGFPIYHKVLDKIHWTKAKFRSFYIPYGEKGKIDPNTTKAAGVQINECKIFYANGMDSTLLRY
jgi:hypothetical protein